MSEEIVLPSCFPTHPVLFGDGPTDFEKEWDWTFRDKPVFDLEPRVPLPIIYPDFDFINLRGLNRGRFPVAAFIPDDVQPDHIVEDSKDA